MKVKEIKKYTIEEIQNVTEYVLCYFSTREFNEDEIEKIRKGFEILLKTRHGVYSMENKIDFEIRRRGHYTIFDDGSVQSYMSAKLKELSEKENANGSEE